LFEIPRKQRTYRIMTPMDLMARLVALIARPQILLARDPRVVARVVR
jgi:hypothetical protein